MHKNEKCAILDEVDEVMYLTSIEDYGLIFMNEKLKKLINVTDESYVGKKCYEIIHNEQLPCEFCKRFDLNNENFECKKRYIHHFDGFYNIKAKSILLNDELVRLIITDDITEIETKNVEIQRRVKAEESIFNYVSNLNTEKNLDIAIDKILQEITKYYQADRGYVFDIDYKKKIVNNTHEYNQEGIEPQIDNLQNLPIEIISRWIDIFTQHGFIFIDSLDDELDPKSDEYKLLKEQDIYRLLALPFYVEGKLVGFIGIDNPKYDYKDITMLKSISFFVFYDITRRQQVKKLERLSSYDTLTGLKNRNSYIYQIEELEEQHPNNIGVIYIDLNGLKEANDKYGHKYGDMKLQAVASIMTKHFEGDSYRVGGDEFVVIITNISEEIFSKRFNLFMESMKDDESINISVGYVYEKEPNAIEPLITKADELMYIEKVEYYKSRK